jgi:hypothetical protein
MSAFYNPLGYIALGLSCAFAVLEEWSLREFCWSTWLASLAYSWACAASAPIRIILGARGEKAALEVRFGFLKEMPFATFFPAITLAALVAGWLAFYLYSYLFGFYGIFLSVFAEMEPHALFGRNGFINSDFFTPVTYLLGNFWPMVAGTLLANAGDFVRGNPWQRFVPAHEILRMHVLAIGMPFLALIAWAVFRDNYQQPTIVVLMCLFYLMPKRRVLSKPPGPGSGQT